MKSTLAIVALALLSFSSLQAGDPPKPYPLQTCLVSGEKLGGMGKPVSETYEGQEYKFCCKGCVKKFQDDPAKYAKELAAAEKAGS